MKAIKEIDINKAEIIENPMVSIILPTYNRVDVITRSIDSILQQTYKRFELIIVDDGSTDNTNELIMKYKDSRIRFYKLDDNSGALIARNFGIKASKGEFIAFQDSDDEWHPQKLELQIKAFYEAKNITQKPIGLCYCNMIFKQEVEPIYDLTDSIEVEAKDLMMKLVIQPCIGTPTMLMHRKVWEQIGEFDINLESFEDWDYSIRVSELFSIICIELPLFYVYVTSGSRDHNHFTRMKSEFYI